MQNSGFSAGNTVVWIIALAAGKTLAENLTILGAASNVIILEDVERKELFPLRLRNF